MIKHSSNYLNFIDIAVKVSRILPDYSGKFSKQDFTQKQLMTLYILKQKSKMRKIIKLMMILREHK